MAVGHPRQTTQRGVYTITVVAVLSALTLIAARAITTTTLDAVRITTNTHMAAEASYAAEDAIAQARTWMTATTNDPATADWPANAITGTSVSFTVNNGGSTLARVYTTSFGFEVSGDLVRVFGRATDGGTSTATVSEWLEEERLTFDSSVDVPLLLAECISNGGSINGNPDIHADVDGIPPNTKTTLAQKNGCGASFGNLNNQNGEGIIAGSHAGGDQWPEIFDVPRAQFHADYQAGNYSSQNVYVYTPASLPNANAAPDTFTMPDYSSGSGAEFQTVNAGATVKSWGTPADPAVVVIQGCPSLSGNYTFVGILYIESATNPEDTASFSCDLQGVGGFKIIGSIVVNGDTPSVNGNLEVISAEAGGISPGSFPSLGYVAFPGTWTDLEAQ